MRILKYRISIINSYYVNSGELFVGEAYGWMPMGGNRQKRSEENEKQGNPAGRDPPARRAFQPAWRKVSDEKDLCRSSTFGDQYVS